MMGAWRSGAATQFLLLAFVASGARAEEAPAVGLWTIERAVDAVVEQARQREPLLRDLPVEYADMLIAEGPGLDEPVVVAGGPEPVLRAAVRRQRTWTAMRDALRYWDQRGLVPTRGEQRRRLDGAIAVVIEDLEADLAYLELSESDRLSQGLATVARKREFGRRVLELDRGAQRPAPSPWPEF